MHEIIKWVSEARPDKDIGVAMTYYRVQAGQICATDGRLTAGHPWPNSDEFLVSGIEFEKVMARMDGEPTLESAERSITITSDRFTATIDTLAVDSWEYPTVEGFTWLPIPEGFVDGLRSLRAFVDDKPSQEWLGCIALQDDNMYATNNKALAGTACAVGEVKVLMPAYTVDFLLRRTENLEAWAWSDKYVAFKWSTGAWVRSVVVIGEFHKKAAEMVRAVYDMEPTQEITEEFRAAFADVAGLAEDTLIIYADRMESTFKKSKVVAACECELPEGKDRTIWGAGILAPVIAKATHWQPSVWPERTPFKGENFAGFIMGRKVA